VQLCGSESVTLADCCGFAQAGADKKVGISRTVDFKKKRFIFLYSAAIHSRVPTAPEIFGQCKTSAVPHVIVTGRADRCAAWSLGVFF
jgi:hypothetical protein